MRRKPIKCVCHCCEHKYKRVERSSYYDNPTWGKCKSCPNTPLVTAEYWNGLAHNVRSRERELARLKAYGPRKLYRHC